MRSRKGMRVRRLVAVCAGLGVAVAVVSSLGTASAATNEDKVTGGGTKEHAGTGPTPGDFVDIKSVRPNNARNNISSGARTGLFTSDCGTNENRHNNPDNFIVAPGKSNGAHHLHDYVGNESTDGDSDDKSLDAAGTTCVNDQDKSAYFWPVLRDLTKNGNDAKRDGGGKDHNVGAVLQPVQVKIEFLGNPGSDVVPMPNHLRVITGDAKAVTNGPKNANAQWTCTGFENRITQKYPLCPRGSRVERILDFPGCWDGKNTDSADHRSHVAFANANGACPKKFKAIPQLRYTLTYEVPPGPKFAVDSFPEEEHNPITDHADFEAVLSTELRNRIADCINSGRTCDNS